MRSGAIIGVAVLLVLPAIALAASVEEVFQEFGLFGTWARDCSSPATPVNPHVSITIPSAGLVLEDHDLGPDFAVNRYSVLSAVPVSHSNVSVQVIFQPGTEVEERQKLVFSVNNNTRRTLFNQSDAGAIRVKDGIAVARGSKTPLLRKCEEGRVSR
ncbi:MAG TPA: hypothetical protein VH558_05210 [Pseudolabrys sp.]|jgi:hypothetical protein